MYITEIIILYVSFDQIKIIQFISLTPDSQVTKNKKQKFLYIKFTYKHIKII